MKYLLIVSFLIAPHVSEGFVIQARASQFGRYEIQPTSSRFFMSGVDDEDNSNNKQLLVKEDADIASSEKSSSESETPYPLDLPSPILLATSMLLAISSVGTWILVVDSWCETI